MGAQNVYPKKCVSEIEQQISAGTISNPSYVREALRQLFKNPFPPNPNTRSHSKAMKGFQQLPENGVVL